jgi:hypothetical protein
MVEPVYRPRDARIEQAYLSPDADFSGYEKLMASPIEVYFPEDAPKPADADPRAPVADVPELRRRPCVAGSGTLPYVKSQTGALS